MDDDQDTLPVPTGGRGHLRAIPAHPADADTDAVHFVHPVHPDDAVHSVHPVHPIRPVHRMHLVHE